MCRSIQTCEYLRRVAGMCVAAVAHILSRKILIAHRFPKIYKGGGGRRCNGHRRVKCDHSIVDKKSGQVPRGRRLMWQLFVHEYLVRGAGEPEHVQLYCCARMVHSLAYNFNWCCGSLLGYCCFPWPCICECRFHTAIECGDEKPSLRHPLALKSFAGKLQ